MQGNIITVFQVLHFPGAEFPAGALLHAVDGREVMISGAIIPELVPLFREGFCRVGAQPYIDNDRLPCRINDKVAYVVMIMALAIMPAMSSYK